MKQSWWSRIRKLETSALKKTDFYPALPQRFDQLCLGTKSRNLGDALVLTPLFLKLKEKYPHINLSGFIRAFNPVVLQEFPFPIPIERGPQSLFGDDLNSGSGHLIEQKLQAFHLPYAEREIRPVIFLSEGEKARADDQLRKIFPQKDPLSPLWIIHPWGKTWKNLVAIEVWESWISLIPENHRVLQVGLPGEERVQGASFYEIDPRTFDSARELFAILQRAHAFLGIDSGPMHVASAFQVPACILVKTSFEGVLKEAMHMRKEAPYFDPRVRPFANLYVDQHQVEVISSSFRVSVCEWIEERR